MSLGRNIYIQIAVHPREKEEYQRQAARAETNMSEWIRQTLKAAIEGSGGQVGAHRSSGPTGQRRAQPRFPQPGNDDPRFRAAYAEFNAKLRAQGIPEISAATFRRGKEDGNI